MSLVTDSPNQSTASQGHFSLAREKRPRERLHFCTNIKNSFQLTNSIYGKLLFYPFGTQSAIVYFYFLGYLSCRKKDGCIISSDLGNGNDAVL